jgi:hypothetical protein
MQFLKFRMSEIAYVREGGCARVCARAAQQDSSTLPARPAVPCHSSAFL